MQTNDVQKAADTVRGQVYTPVFFQKVAHNCGLTPRTEQEAADMLAMAASLRHAYDTQQKTASEHSPLAKMRANLDNKLGRQTKQAAFSPAMINQAAAAAALNPELANNVLTVIAHSR